MLLSALLLYLLSQSVSSFCLCLMSQSRLSSIFPAWMPYLPPFLMQIRSVMTSTCSKAEMKKKGKPKKEKPKREKLRVKRRRQLTRNQWMTNLPTTNLSMMNLSMMSLSTMNLSTMSLLMTRFRPRIQNLLQSVAGSAASVATPLSLRISSPGRFIKLTRSAVKKLRSRSPMALPTAHSLILYRCFSSSGMYPCPSILASTLFCQPSQLPSLVSTSTI